MWGMPDRSLAAVMAASATALRLMRGLMFRDKIKNEGKSALIVSHDNRLFGYADRTVRILDGGIAE